MKISLHAGRRFKLETHEKYYIDGAFIDRVLLPETVISAADTVIKYAIEILKFPIEDIIVF